ncbi:hypothetical protein IL306_003057 [Fusarium sp. DS 682]|nr:hypothetical protein IL306_003057 [Fusarium sp. DS 682]
MTLPTAGTSFLNRDLLLKSLEDQQWFEKNIPLLDIPDKHIQDVYYYRWQIYKEHLVYTGAQYGYMASEFLDPVSYGAPSSGIVAAAGHHITEGRWLRDTRYGQDIANYWLAGPGQFPKPMRDDVNKDTSEITALCDDSELEDEYRNRAKSLQIALQKHLWDHESKFYKHQARDDNPSSALLGTREIMGYFPWTFNMPCENSQFVAFSQLTDPEGFISKFGPTTAERRNYYAMLHRYACTQYKNGQPYVAEAHHPDNDVWIYDGRNHSEDYNHSTFVDNVLAGLIGLRAQPDDTILINPLIPASWEYFAVENAAYHGHSITVLWDGQGSVYNQGKGLRIYVDGQLAGSRRTISPITVNVGLSMPSPVSTCINIATNGQRCPQLPMAFASYTSPVDDPMRVINGMIFRTGIPQNSRWTSYNSPNPKDHFVVDMHKNQAVCNVRLFFYDDSDGVRIPTTYDFQYWVNDARVTVPGQARSPMPTRSNAETKIDFPTILTSRLRVVAPNAGSGVGWGLSEFEIWRPSDDTNCLHMQTSMTLKCS